MLGAEYVFSRSRCCVMYSTSPLGRTGTISAAASAVAAGMFSNSNVTRSTLRAKRPNGVQIVVRAAHFAIGDLAGGRVVVGRKRVDAIAHSAGGDGEHASQLPAAQHADGGARQNRLRHGSVSPSTLLGLLAAEVL